MKKLILAGCFLIAFTIAHAQQTPGVDTRQQQQRTRIREGVASGELNRGEAAKLRAEQRHIRRAECRAKADGKVTPTERAKLHRKQNRAGRDIRRQKHDQQERVN
jgi:phage protein D